MITTSRNISAVIYKDESCLTVSLSNSLQLKMDALSIGCILLICSVLGIVLKTMDRYRKHPGPAKLKRDSKEVVIPTGNCAGSPTAVPMDKKISPISVNYHFTRQCNYKCGFCFHTAKTSFVLPIEAAKQGLKLLKDAGMQKINFSGGEPFIVKKGTFVGELVKYCKEELLLPSVSIVSNGSLVHQDWFQKYGKYLDILAVSCDSFNPDTNELIGRQHGSKNHLASLRTVKELCTEYKVAFKLNTVVNTHNKHENMVEEISQLDPCRWKVFQCLLIDGENAGPDALRNAKTFVISNSEFSAFLERHSDVKCLVPESNEKMQNSYLILDEYMRFLDCTKGSKDPSRSILDVGVENALKFSGFDERMFFKRGGKYTWSKADMRLEW